MEVLTRLGLQCQTPLRSYPLSLIPTPCSLFPSTVPFAKFRWGLLSFLSFLSLLWLLSPAKVKSTPSPRPKTGVWQKIFWVCKIYMVHRVHLNFESEKILGLEKLGFQNILCPKQIQAAKNFGSKNLSGSRKFWVQKSFRPGKNVRSKKKLGKKFCLRSKNNFGSEIIFCSKTWKQTILGSKSFWGQRRGRGGWSSREGQTLGYISLTYMVPTCQILASFCA